MWKAQKSKDQLLSLTHQLPTCVLLQLAIQTMSRFVIIKAVAICNNAIAFVEKGSNFIWSTYPVIMADTTSTRLGLISGVMSAVVGVGRIKTLPFSSN